MSALTSPADRISTPSARIDLLCAQSRKSVSLLSAAIASRRLFSEFRFKLLLVSRGKASDLGSLPIPSTVDSLYPIDSVNFFITILCQTVRAGENNKKMCNC